MKCSSNFNTDKLHHLLAQNFFGFAMIASHKAVQYDCTSVTIYHPMRALVLVRYKRKLANILIKSPKKFEKVRLKGGRKSSCYTGRDVK
jgi:hypothetical protein